MTAWNKEKTIATAVAIAIVVFAVAYSLVSRGNSGSSSSVVETSNSAESAGTSGVPTSPTATSVPLNTIVPNEGDVDVSPSVAVPEVQTPAHLSGSASYRQFSLTVDNSSFTPSTVIVHKGDIVDLEVTAVGKNYEFTQPDYGFNVSVPQGTTKKIQFQAVNQGKFTFYCSTCGGPASGPVGYLVITN